MTFEQKKGHLLLLAAVLIGGAGTAFAGTPCGTNLEYEIAGTILRLTSPDPSQDATVQAEAFKNNTVITSVSLPENVGQIGSQAFMGCTALSEVELGNVQDISTSAFEGCTSLTDVVIPPTVTAIGGYAFYNCSALSNVLCRPQTAPALGTDGFTGCAPGLKICVPSLGAYRYEANWSTYYDSQLTLCFLDENDEQTVTESKISLFRDSYARTEIDIFRTLRKAGCFNTLTLPFRVPDISLSPLAGAEVYEFAGASVVDDALQLDVTPLTGNTLVAGTPYLIQWPDNGEVLNRLHFSGITWDDDATADDAGTGEVTLHGFYGKTHINDDTRAEQHLNLFLGGNDLLYWPEDGDDENAKMPGFRAWFRITGTSVGGAMIRRGMPAHLHRMATPTALDEIQKDLLPAAKVLRNGQLVIIRNGETFSINGQKL